MTVLHFSLQSRFCVFVALCGGLVQATSSASDHDHHLHRHSHSHGQQSSAPATAKPTEEFMNHDLHSNHDHHSPRLQPSAIDNSSAHNKSDTHQHSIHGDTTLHRSHNTGHSMMMYFHLVGDTPLLFEGWNLDSAGVIAGATIGLAVIAALYEALKMLREVLMAMTLRRVEQDALEGHKNPPRNEQQAQENAASDRKQFIRLPLGDHMLQTVLHMVQVLISYLLMLAVMTYNVWLLLGVVMGGGIGYFVVARYIFTAHPTTVSKLSEHCH
ncbi:protein SLC31A2-like [Corticium candelabrum]|uniref:protein SLC31A2-like n=1 Tax=Corticium candelabrum TaxID=121492 RepID=UPI002E256231|nr:protein SLC31A2-like [Corticium candelabrum]